MANGNDDFYDEYDFPPEEELFPMERAASAVMLAQEMKREEDQLPIDMGFAMAPQAPVVSAPLPEQTSQDRRAAYDMAIRRQDDRAALSAYQNMAAMGEGMPGVISIRSDLQPIPEPVSPAQMQYEAQRSYMDEINRGVPQQNAFAKYGPLMFPPTSASAKSLLPQQMAPAPVWVPPDPATGSPGYIYNPKSGSVHVQGTTRSPETTSKEIRKRELDRKISNAENVLERLQSSKTATKDEIEDAQRSLQNWRNQRLALDEGASAPTIAPAPTTVNYGTPITKGRFTIRSVVR